MKIFKGSVDTPAAASVTPNPSGKAMLYVCPAIHYAGHRMIDIRRFQMSHLDSIEVGAFEQQKTGLFPKYREYLADLRDVYTLLEDGEVVIVGGLSILWSGVAEGFFMTTLRVLSKPWPFIKAMRRGIEVLQARRSLRRIQTVAQVGDVVSHQWIQWLGLKPDGLMEKYGPDGSDYIRYAKTWEGR